MQYFRNHRAAYACGEAIIALCFSFALGGAVSADPAVEFDFARTANCRDVTPAERSAADPGERLMEVNLPVTARFHGVAADDVDELVIEIYAPAAGMRVASYEPTTQLATDVTKAIETTTTSHTAKSLEATLGGTLPAPYSELVAHLTPSITASTSRGGSATEKVTRLPPRYAVVVSGTAYEGHGAFFKLKRSSQTSLEGVHALTVTFIAPRDWQSGAIRVGCSARGQRKLLFVKQDATLGRAAGEVMLRLVHQDAATRCTDAATELATGMND